MDSTSGTTDSPPFCEGPPFRAVSGRLRRRSSEPSLPTERLCLDIDPHDACLAREPLHRPLEALSPSEKPARRWARLRAVAKYNLYRPRESRASTEEMMLEDLSLQERTPFTAAPLPAPQLAPRLARLFVPIARTLERRQSHGGLVSGFPRQPTRLLPLKRSRTSAGKFYARALRAIWEVSRVPSSNVPAIEVNVPDVEERHAAPSPPGSPVTSIMGSRPPMHMVHSNGSAVILMPPSPQKPRESEDPCPNTVEEEAGEKEKGPESAVDSLEVKSRSSGEEPVDTSSGEVVPEVAPPAGGEELLPFAEPAEECEVDKEIAAMVADYQPILDDNEDMERGRQGRGGR